jgi:hypothetical protein
VKGNALLLVHGYQLFLAYRENFFSSEMYFVECTQKNDGEGFQAPTHDVVGNHNVNPVL